MHIIIDSIRFWNMSIRNRIVLALSNAIHYTHFNGLKITIILFGLFSTDRSGQDKNVIVTYFVVHLPSGSVFQLSRSLMSHTKHQFRRNIIFNSQPKNCNEKRAEKCVCWFPHEPIKPICCFFFVLRLECKKTCELRKKTEEKMLFIFANRFCQHIRIGPLAIHFERAKWCTLHYHKYVSYGWYFYENCCKEAFFAFAALLLIQLSE